MTCKEISKYIYSDKFSTQSKPFCSWYANQDATRERDCLRELKERSETGIWWVHWSWQSQQVGEMCLFLRWSFSLVFPLCFISGFVIVGEDNTGKLDLGIFIASIVPDGPADKDGRIKPGLKHRQTETKEVTCDRLWKEICYDLFILCLSFVRSGGRLISLNKTSLEGVTFSDAAAILQNSPEEVELIVSQPKCKMIRAFYTATTMFKNHDLIQPLHVLI